MIFLIVLEFAEKYTDATKLKKQFKNLRNNLLKDNIARFVSMWAGYWFWAYSNNFELHSNKNLD